MISVPCLARFLLKNVNVAPYLLSLRVQSKKDLPKPQIWHKMTRLMSSKFFMSSSSRYKRTQRSDTKILHLLNQFRHLPL